MKELYVAIPAITYNTKEQESTDKNADECELIEVTRFVDLDQVESYQEAIPVSDFRDNNKIWTFVCMRSGDNFIANLDCDTFHTIMQLHAEAKTNG